MSTENCLGHQIFITEDGSPSLKPLSENSEWMHSRKGALSESLYIYAEAALKASELSNPLSIASVGLGLGYNELIAAALDLTQQIKVQKLYSFEKIKELQLAFEDWLNEKKSPLADTYELLITQLGQHYKIDSKEIKQQMQSWIEKSIYEAKSSWPNTESLNPKVNCIFFDAYSSKTMPELWSFENLNHFLKNETQQSCTFSTYAATGTLNKVLKNNDFKRLKRDGFGLKRESTLALRTSAF